MSSRLGLTPEDLQSELNRKPEPRLTLLKDIAQELSVPEFVFFMEEAPTLESIPDFRSTVPVAKPYSRETVEAIQLAASIQRSASTLGKRVALKLPRISTGQNADVDRAAQLAREFFGISLQDQVRAKDTREFYTICRRKIEEKGIFVLHDSFPEADGSGFCLADPSYPIVVINTKKQTRGRRLFTLIHEVAHVLLGASGISDPFVQKNSTETLCNRFAGSFLVPKAYVVALLGPLVEIRNPSRDDVVAAARRLKISQEATVLRLQLLGIYEQGSYSRWKALVEADGNPDYTEKGGGAKRPPPQEKVKLAKYGFRFARVFEELLDSGRTNEIGIYRSSGLKPKFVKPYFEYARSLGVDDSFDLEIDDE